MAGGDKALIEGDRRRVKAGFQITSAPLERGLAFREYTLLCCGKFGGRPVNGFNLLP